MVITLLYILTGIISGTLSGLLGLGGGSIIVPMLAMTLSYSGYDEALNMHIAASTSLCIMIFTSYAAVKAHHHHESVEMDVLKNLLPGLAIGVALGVMIADGLPTEFLRVGFGIFLLLVAMRMFFAFTVNPSRALPGSLAMSVFGVCVGLNSGVLGVGSGMLTIPFLTYCNVPMHKAVSITAMCSLVLAIVGTFVSMFTGQNEVNIPTWSTGYIHWPAVIAIASASVVFAPIGVWLSRRTPVLLLKRIFAAVILFAGVHMLWP